MGSIRARVDNKLLFFDFRFDGQRCREQTALPDSAANRKRLQKALDKIEEQIAAGTFNYATTFPAASICRSRRPRQRLPVFRRRLHR
jgi:integrase